MKHYDKLLRMGCFTLEDLSSYIPNTNTALSILRDYAMKGYVQRIKRNLYVALDLVSGEPVANRYQIASKITDSSYVSYHSAFDYYGYTNQVSYEVQVSSDTKFASFDFNRITYSYVQSKLKDGIDESGKIRVTSRERTLLDNIDAFSKHMGLEELLRCINLIPMIDEKELLFFLKEYDKQFLYQKTAFLLLPYNQDLLLSNTFFDECKKHMGNSKRYLFPELKHRKNTYNKQWQLIVPANLDMITSKGIDNNVSI